MSIVASLQLQLITLSYSEIFLTDFILVCSPMSTMLRLFQRCTILRSYAPKWGQSPNMLQLRSFMTTSSILEWKISSNNLREHIIGRNTYEGELKDGKRCGMGKLTYFGGGSFVGEFKDGKCWNGEGTLRLPGGQVYDGSLKDGLFHGQGSLTYKDGRILKGEFREGKPWNGEGLHQLPGGSFYEGTFQEGLFLKGKLTYKDGNTSEGEFKEGRLWSGKKVDRLEDGEVVTREFEGGMQSSGVRIVYVGRRYKRWEEGMADPKSV